MSGPSPALPAGLAAAISAQLERRPRGALAESAQRLSESYRARKPTADAIRDVTDALAYALTRMPATYAAVVTALGRLQKEQPAFAPQSLLDVGCGLGAASYAATQVWPEIESVEMLDRSRAFLALAAALAAESGPVQVATARVAEADIARLSEAASAHDLVAVAYALTELPDADLPRIAAALWGRTRGALVIVEPGTPRDHARLMGVRARLIELGATILAPCPHAAPCPLQAPDWCHFSVRLPRSRDHKLLKGADAPFEDEKFSWLIAGRTGAPAPARLIAPPRAGKPGISTRVCGRNGIRETFTPKRDKARYERVRKKNWGDPIDALPEDNG
ncbi:small ribosomal subunit Rsm22 family protein [Methylocystis sp. ATCC 49242]|uniref:small ribosomal subunit Rsm22 family protein n=1 Tax=Methylocystis sp. ATCC 49242 TaxID=622637 RepID=UPI0001F86F48|nr:small ribosomal subunit Rsm22 family protein [Methylocystis sp. ATCC 49242]